MTFVSDNKDIENKAGFVSQYQKLTKLLKTTERDEVHIYSNVQWEEYENILLGLGDSSWCRVSYLAVEVNHTSGILDDLEIYKRLRVPEVWIWDKSNNLSIYILKDTEYKKSNKSKFLEDLDVHIVQEYVLKMKNESPRIVKKEFIEKITYS